MLEISSERLKQWRFFPEDFVSDCFKATPTSQQREGLRAFASYPYITIRSGHGTGKDTFASWCILNFMTTRRLSRCLATAPTYRQLYDILWAELGKWLFRSPLKELFDLRTDRLVMKGYERIWWARAVSISVKGTPEEQAETLAGYHEDHFLAVVDESSGVPDPVFQPVESFMTKPDNRVILIGNPTKTYGYFKDSFSDPMFHKLHWSSEESENVSRDWIQRYRDKYGRQSSTYQIRVLGNFADSSNSGLISESSLQECLREMKEYQALLKGADFEHEVVIGALDPSRQGRDETVFSLLVGNVVFSFKQFFQDDLYELSEAVISYVENELPVLDYLILDMNGLGYGVYDIMQKTWSAAKRKLRGVITHERAIDDLHFNLLRDELLWKVSLLTNSKGWILPDDEEMKEELLFMRDMNEGEGKISITPKKLFKKTFKRSCGKLDILALLLHEHEIDFEADDYVIRPPKPLRLSSRRRIRRERRKIQDKWKVA